MKKALIISASVLTVGSLALSGCGANSANTTATTAATSSSTPETSGMPTDSMGTASATPDSGSASTTGDHNNADTMFARMMIPHHEDAITMSNTLLGKQGIDSRVTALAERIKAEQTPEIAQLTASLEAWGEPTNTPSATMDGMNGSMGGSMNGSMGAGNMQALDAAQGTEAAKVFLDQMIVHHTSAISMAEMETANGSNPDTIKLAESIVTSQRAQIQEMKDLLTTL